MATKRYSPARRTLQVLIVFILSAIISRTAFAATSNVESRAQQYSCYSNM
ncbi:MAG: hypothetical protein JSU04_14690 [Bdellovibrionales bacterium]|nr:hypothetical protein [Bdellovibrionales bacterium]